MKKLRILEICPFSKGVCGVFSRVLAESLEFRKLGHKVMIFSSDIEKGTGNPVSELQDNIGSIKIKRFKSNQGAIDRLLSKNVTYFNFDKEMIEYNPDVIITHLLHPHSAKVCRKISDLKRKNPGIKIILVPHAPFNVKRGFPLNLATAVWRNLSRLDLNRFDNIIAITKWEMPYLKGLRVDLNKVVYIPNGLSSEYYKKLSVKPKKDVLFLGRIAPVKNIELLVQAAKSLPDVMFDIVGAPEPSYLNHIKNMSSNLKNIEIHPPIYDIKKKIKLIDNHRIFVLPSKREAMPQVLIEAMSRGKLVLSSDTDGGKEIIKHGKNGFLFNIGNSGQLASLISKNAKGNKEIENNARKTSEEFAWKNLIKKYLEIFK